MKYTEMYPAEESSEPSLPIGFIIVYEPGDEEERDHLLNFLRRHFQITEDQAFIDVTPEERALYPLCFSDGEEIPFKELLYYAEMELPIEESTRIGFHFSQQFLLRTYEEFLNQDRVIEFDGLREFFAKVEVASFGSKSCLN